MKFLKLKNGGVINLGQMISIDEMEGKLTIHHAAQGQGMGPIEVMDADDIKKIKHYLDQNNW